MSYELVVFDWDGTLMDSTHMIATSLQAACGDVGIAIPEERDARYVIGLGLSDSLDHVAPGLDEPGRRRLAERYRHHFLEREHEAPLYAGVREMLADLHGRGRRLAVATGKARRGLDRALEATGLAPWFEATRCADEGFAKPHPEVDAIAVSYGAHDEGLLATRPALARCASVTDLHRWLASHG